MEDTKSVERCIQGKINSGASAPNLDFQGNEFSVSFR